jgi:hypothetical protein
MRGQEGRVTPPITEIPLFFAAVFAFEAFGWFVGWTWPRRLRAVSPITHT